MVCLHLLCLSVDKQRTSVSRAVNLALFSMKKRKKNITKKGQFPCCVNSVNPVVGDSKVAEQVFQKIIISHYLTPSPASLKKDRR